MQIVDNQTQRHWGSYDAVDHGFDDRMQSPFGQETPFPSPGAPATPSLPSLQELIGVEQRGSLQYVPPHLQPALLNLLHTTDFVPLPGAGGVGGSVATGTVQPSISPIGMPWTTQAIQDGNAILFELASAATPQPVFVIAVSPQDVYALAQSGGRYVIVDIPSRLEGQAQQVPHQQAGPLGPAPKAAGMQWAPVIFIGAVAAGTLWWFGSKRRR